MAKLERTLTGDFDDILWRLDQAVLNGSMSATLEDRSDFSIGPVQVSVRMYERYSALGGNRVAMCLTLAGEGDRLRLTAITAGGSQAMFFKMNTFGEEAFLDTLARVADTL
ncbi:MAG: hypothetical protein HFF28_06385 [Oscillospiraceae bacterium]|nr:hypothetical protein [Oscillospiraceae bacterium]